MTTASDIQIVNGQVETGRNLIAGRIVRPFTVQEQVLMATASVADRSITVAARLYEYPGKRDKAQLIGTLRQAEYRRDAWLHAQRFGLDYPWRDNGCLAHQ